MLLSCQDRAEMYRLSWCNHRCTLSYRQKFLTSFRDGSMAAPNVAIRLTGRGNGFLMVDVTGEQRGRTISLVMETACRGNRHRPEKGRYIHKGRKRRTTAAEKGSREGISNKKRRREEKERGGRESSYLPSPRLSKSVFLPSCRNS